MDENDVIFYRRHLPHIQAKGYSIFITFRLAGSLPALVIDRLKLEYESEIDRIASSDAEMKNELYQKIKNRYFVKFDDIMHEDTRNSWLSNSKVAQNVMGGFRWFEEKYFHLIALTIMPNHIHSVIIPKNDVQSNSPYLLSQILRKLKSKTAVECNKILGRHGAFWQNESYDHVIRNHKELINIVKYIIDNPVKAGLCSSNKEWPWTYVNHDLMSY